MAAGGIPEAHFWAFLCTPLPEDPGPRGQVERFCVSQRSASVREHDEKNDVNQIVELVFFVLQVDRTSNVAVTHCGLAEATRASRGYEVT